MEFIVSYGDLGFSLTSQYDVNIKFTTILCSRYIALSGNSEFLSINGHVYLQPKKILKSMKM